MLDDVLGRRRDLARQIDHHVVELVAQLLEEDVQRGRVRHDRIAERLLAAQHIERVRLSHHGAFHEQRIDPTGMLQRLAKSGRRLEIERERHRAELQVEIDQCHSASASIGDRPRNGGREHRGPDAAASTGDCDQPAASIALAPLCCALDDVKQRFLNQRR